MHGLSSVVALRKPDGLCACGTRWNVGGGEQGARVVARDELDPADMDGRGWYATRHFTTTLIGVDVEEAVEHRYQTLDRVIAYCAGVEAECGVALKHKAGWCVFKSLMQDLNTLVSGGQARRDMLGSMEPRGGSETELMQTSTARRRGGRAIQGCDGPSA